jgi:hypothetical protein
MPQRKYSLVYFLYRVPEFLCCRMIWALLPPFLWEMAPPPCLSTACTVGLAHQHSLAGVETGGPKPYNSTETLVLYTQYLLYDWGYKIKVP